MATRNAQRLPPWFYRLTRVCARLGHSVHDSEDLAQEAYVRFLEYRKTHVIRDEVALLQRIATNLAINHHRGRKIAPVPIDELARLEIYRATVDGVPDLTQQLIARERLEQVTRTLCRVSPRTCQIFIAHRAGYCYAEIAAEFHITPRTVQKHITRATTLLGLRRPPKSRFYSHTT